MADQHDPVCVPQAQGGSAVYVLPLHVAKAHNIRCKDPADHLVRRGDTERRIDAAISEMWEAMAERDALKAENERLRSDMDGVLNQLDGHHAALPGTWPWERVKFVLDDLAGARAQALDDVVKLLRDHYPSDYADPADVIEQARKDGRL